MKRQYSKKYEPREIEGIIDPVPIRRGSVSFLEAFPAVAKMWAYEKNCRFRPDQFSYASNVSAWFKCPKGPDHLFRAKLLDMGEAFINKSAVLGCPFCRGIKVSVTNSLKNRFPHLAKEWDEQRNEIGADQVTYGSQKKVFWICPKGHKYSATIGGRTSHGNGCRKCNLGSPIDLREQPLALQQFDKEKNIGISPYALAQGCRVHWRCTKNKKHTWVASCRRDMDASRRCPYCNKKKGGEDNNLFLSHPHYAAQWHPEKNGDKTPYMVTPGSHFKAWWKCEHGPDHEWQAAVKVRVRANSGCPFCGNHKTSVTNVIATLNPELALEWHPVLNGTETAADVRASSTEKKWWLCSLCSYAWNALVTNRVTLGSGCPSCANVKKTERLRALRSAMKKDEQ